MTRSPSLLRVHLELPNRSPEELKRRFERRNVAIDALSNLIGVTIHSMSSTQINNANCIASLLARHGDFNAVWWGGRVADLKETTDLYNTLQSYLVDHGFSSDVLYEHPDTIDESANLSRYFPLLQKARVSQPETVVIPIPELESILQEQEIRHLLESKIEASFTVDELCFIRTYYGTPKTHPGFNFAFSRESLINKASDILFKLQGKQQIGGLAIREALDINPISERDNLYNEFRVFAVFGRPVMWFVDCDMQSSRQFFECSKTTFLSADYVQDIYDQVSTISNSLRSQFLCIDFAIVSDGSLVVIEINPGHSSGWIHDSAIIGVYGQLFRKLVGLDYLSTSECVSLAKEAGVDLWGHGTGYDFM